MKQTVSITWDTDLLTAPIAKWVDVTMPSGGTIKAMRVDDVRWVGRNGDPIRKPKAWAIVHPFNDIRPMNPEWHTDLSKAPHDALVWVTDSGDVFLAKTDGNQWWETHHSFISTELTPSAWMPYKPGDPEPNPYQP